MKEPNKTSGDDADGSEASSNFVTESQLNSILNLHQLKLKNLAYDTLNANQEINLLAIKNVGIVYGIAAVGYFLGAIFTAEISLSRASASLQSLLVLFAAAYGLIMLLSEGIQMAMPSTPPVTEDPDSATNEE
jgi:hypothetical protein